jgi:hypothetical protein
MRREIRDRRQRPGSARLGVEVGRQARAELDQARLVDGEPNFTRHVEAAGKKHQCPVDGRRRLENLPMQSGCVIAGRAMVSTHRDDVRHRLHRHPRTVDGGVKVLVVAHPTVGMRGSR